MKVAIVGSRGLTCDIGGVLPSETTELISGGAKGIDTCVREYAQAHGLPILEFLPDYKKYGRGAPIIRNGQIIEAADFVLAIWDGKSRGTYSSICKAIKAGKPLEIYFSDDVPEEAQQAVLGKLPNGNVKVVKK
jgi:hypothetical protein